MTRTCPNPNCQKTGHVTTAGTFFRKCDSRTIQRYRCTLCQTRFSDATGTLEFRQRKRRENLLIRRLLVSNVGMNQIARIVNVNYKTVARKLGYLSRKCALENERNLSNRVASVAAVQFDEMETFEVTKCKPLAIAVAVESGSRIILSAKVSPMPPKSSLARKAETRYGKRANGRPQGLTELLESLTPYLSGSVEVKSDKCPFYRGVVRRVLEKRAGRKVSHLQFKGRKPRAHGHGELKTGGFDPLFSLNHTCAIIRGHIGRLIRRTWNTTKKWENLEKHLQVYIHSHNAHILGLARC